MNEIGVKAIVAGLSSFLGDMGKIDGAITKLSPGTKLLSMAFEGLGSVVSGLVDGALRVLEYTLGNLIADAIEAVISKIKELISDMIQAGNEFQLLSIRLTGFNLPTDAMDDYGSAMAEATELTKEQMKWVQTLGAATPFDPKSIADIYVQARGYGFAADEAKRLTEDTINYTAAMGLGNEALESVVRNLGQMVARGKITSTEIRDLSRSAFLPVADVLQRIVDISDGAFSDVAALQKEISKPGGGVPAELFVEAFEQMVEQEPRFIGAAGRLSRAFLPAMQNVKELITSVGAQNIVAPIFDVLGEKVASMVDLFVKFNEQGDLIVTKRWEDLTAAAHDFGFAVSDVLKDILGLAPDAGSLVDGLTKKIHEWAVKILANKDDIVGFFTNLKDRISNIDWSVIGKLAEQIVDFFTKTDKFGKTGFQELFENIGSAVSTVSGLINDYLVPAWNSVSEWFNQNEDVITLFFQAIQDIFSGLISDLTGGQGPAKSFGDILTQIMWYVVNNKDTILKWVEVLWSVFAVTTVVGGVLQFIMGIIASVGGFVLALVGGFAGLVSIVSLVAPLVAGIGAVFGAITLPVWLLIGAIVALVVLIALNKDKLATILSQLWFIMKYYWNLMVEKVGQAGTDMANYLNNHWMEIKTSALSWWLRIKQTISDKITEIKNTITNINWGQIGTNLMQSIANGISAGARWIVNAARQAATDAYNAALRALGFQSPTSLLFIEMGQNTMNSLATGIVNAASSAANTMRAATAQVSAAALAGATTNIQNTTNVNNNLNIQTSAPAEPIMQDFYMMNSMAGI